MSWYNDYVTRINAYGDTQVDESIYAMQETFESMLDVGANSKTITINGSEYNAIISDNRERDRLGDDKVLYFRFSDTLPDSFSFEWQGKTWLTVNRMYSTTDQHNSFYIRMCNQSIKFLDNNDNVIERYISIDDASSNVKRNREIITTAGKATIAVINDQHTQQISENYRLIVGDKVFKVVGVNSYITDSCIFFTLQEIQKEEADDFTTKIAENSYPSNVPDAPENGIFIEGEDIVYYGFSAEYTATLYEDDAVAPVQPTINFSVDQPSYVTLNVVGNAVTVTPVEDLTYTTKTLVLTATDGTNTSHKTIKIDSI